jgi:hypothetical protein
VGRVNRLMERRHLRRAADQALMTPAFLRPLGIDGGAATNGAPALDARGDADYPKPWGDNPDTNDDEPATAITEPIAVAALHDRLRAPDDFGLDDVPATALAADRAASAPIGIWKPDLIEFRVVQPWYRTKAAAAALSAVGLAAIVVSSVLLVSRGAEQTTSVTGHHRQSPTGVAQQRFLVPQPTVADEEARVWGYPGADQRDPTATA